MIYIYKPELGIYQLIESHTVYSNALLKPEKGPKFAKSRK